MRASILIGTLALALSPSLAYARFDRGPAEPPPAARVEVVHARHGRVWVGGHYGWRHDRYYWSRGHYVHERPGWQWGDGAWEHHGDRYVWHEGGWRR
jgi:hypothetical protein